MPVPKLHVNGVAQFSLSVFFWLVALSIMYLRFTHTVVHISIPPPFIAEWRSTECICNLFISSSVDGHVFGLLPVLDIWNKAAVNIQI